MFDTETVTPVDAQPRPISVMARLKVTTPAPVPPYSGSTLMPAKPSSDNSRRFCSRISRPPVRSSSAATGANRPCAKSRAACWICSCSSEREKSIDIPVAPVTRLKSQGLDCRDRRGDRQSSPFDGQFAAGANSRLRSRSTGAGCLRKRGKTRSGSEKSLNAGKVQRAIAGIGLAMFLVKAVGQRAHWRGGLRMLRCLHRQAEVFQHQIDEKAALIVATGRYIGQYAGVWIVFFQRPVAAGAFQHDLRQHFRIEAVVDAELQGFGGADHVNRQQHVVADLGDGTGTVTAGVKNVLTHRAQH